MFLNRTFLTKRSQSKNVMQIKFLLASLFLFFSSVPLYSQYGVELLAGPAYMIKNHPRFPLLTHLPYQIQLNLNMKGTQRWKAVYPKASWGISLQFQDFGGKENLGFGFGFLPYFTPEIFKKGPLQGRVKLGLGFSILSKYFDPFENPSNIAIGSTLNAFGLAAFQLEWKLRKWSPILELGVIHHSNGSVSPPNLGYNLPYLSIGLKYNWGKSSQDSILPSKIAIRRFSFFIQQGLGIQAPQPRSALFPVLYSSVGFQWNYKVEAQLKAGFDISYKESLYQESKAKGFQTARSDYLRAAFFVGHEWLFGAIGFQVLTGVYLHTHPGMKSIILTQVGLNYYPKNTFLYAKNQIWIGAHIRAYLGLAEFASIQVGYRW